MPDGTPYPVSDIPAVHLALSAFMAVGSNAATNPIPASSLIDEPLMAINYILASWAAQIDPSSLEGPLSLPADFDPCTFATGVGFSTETHVPSKAYHWPRDYS